ncbi:formylglycine-generating enzyme family protein [Odoribacter lunatus]|uniref:formylglycine-generating enzyme family protein n=1 Tax=Odoribacter lunatus TaxID=2941335 RepID=UPI00203D8435|nr:formylglycine-generating enzyme family protein [Odoribacter lunatus]
MNFKFITVVLFVWMLLSGFATGRRKAVFTETAFGIQLKMVYVEGGSFLMGGTVEQGTDIYDDEETIRRVNVDGYYIGVFEVTQGQWKKVMGSNPRDFKKGGNYPVTVSWEEAQEFCTKLSHETGRNYCLPTEAQWEYAARGANKGAHTKYSGGSDIDLVAWHLDNSGSSAHSVGMKQPNALGLYDMSGNVWEWCRDWYNYYDPHETENPKGAPIGTYRVLRGGSWCDYARRCRVSGRVSNAPDVSSSCSGFRIVLIP